MTSKYLRDLRKRTRETRERIKAAETEAIAKMTPQERQIHELKQREHFKDKGRSPKIDGYELCRTLSESF